MLRDKLSEIGIELSDCSVGKHQMTCPFCSADRKPRNKKQKVFAVWVDDGFASYNCCHCNEKGVVFDKTYTPPKKTYTKPNVKVKDNLGDKMKEWFDNRSLNLEDAKDIGIYVETKKFKQPKIAFPYYKNGEVVNVKYRNVYIGDDGDRGFAQESGAEPVVYNYDNCLGRDEIILVEGELDVLAFMKAGFDNVCSIPCGSISKELEEGVESSKFDFLENSETIFKNAKVILALDSDHPGQAMTNELIRRIGRGKCWTVDWTAYTGSNGEKDANDFLKSHGESVLKDAVRNAKAVPITEIANIMEMEEEFIEFLRRGRQPGYSLGFPYFDEYMTVDFGNLTIVTGYPGSGKSEIMANVAHNLAENYKFKSLICSFEDDVKDMLAKLAQIKLKDIVFKDNYVLNDVRKHALPFIHEHFSILQTCESNFTVDKILKLAEEMVYKKGIKVLIIDPFSKIEHVRGGKSETEYIAEVLNKVSAFTKKYKLITFFLAHPTKPERGRLSKLDYPTLYDISGSANWANTADIGLTVFRKQDDDGNKAQCCRLVVTKMRRRRLGAEGSCYLRYNKTTGRYDHASKSEYDNELKDNNNYKN